MECTIRASVSTSTGAERVNSLKQFNYAKVIGVNIMGHQVPIVYKLLLRKSGGKQGVIFYNKSRHHACFLYGDHKHTAECRLKLNFAVDYYRRIMLPGSVGSDGQQTTPYWDQHMKANGVGIVDGLGRELAMTAKRHWHNGDLIYRAPEIRTSCGSGCSTNNYGSDYSPQDNLMVTTGEVKKAVAPTTRKKKTGSGCNSCGGSR